MDEARRRAEAVADEVVRWQSRQHIIEILLVYAADAVAQAVKEKDGVIESYRNGLKGVEEAVGHERWDAAHDEVFPDNQGWGMVFDVAWHRLLEEVDQQAEEIARLTKARNQSIDYSMYLDRCMREQAEAIARLTTELAGAEATNAVLDEEVARLRAEIKRWKDTLEMELTHSQAWVAQAVRAERERAIGLIEVMIRKRNVVGYDICDFCGGKEFRWPEHHPECEHGQLLEALRREPTQ